jgi:GDP-4-dehydro-6-deoxy-D-mannose reductase
VVSEFAHLIAQIEAGKHPPVIKVGNLRAKRDFSDVRDVVRAYRLLLWKGEPGEAYNVCSGRVRTIREVLRTLLSMTRAKIEVEVDAAKFRPADEDFLPGSFAKLKRLTGWTVRIPFRKTLADVLDYWRKIERPRSHRGEKGD